MFHVFMPTMVYPEQETEVKIENKYVKNISTFYIYLLFIVIFERCFQNFDLERVHWVD